MIIKAHSRKDGGQLASYVLEENDEQKAFVLDYRGTTVDDLKTMFRSWEAEATAVTKGQKPLYHAIIRLAPGETLDKDQWFKTIDALEKRLHLTQHPRAVIAHNLNGEAHLHIIYSRLDSERGTLLNMGNDRRAHHAVARKMEKEFGLRELESKPRRDRNGNEQTRSIEHRMAKESGTTRKALCDIVRSAWDASNTGWEFQQQLARFGISMTRGDSRDYNVWHNDKRYDPVRLIENVRTAEFREKMQKDPPRINEQGIERDTSAVTRKASNLNHDQVAAELTSENGATLANQAKKLAAQMRKEIAKYEADELNDGHGLNRRKAENLSANEAKKQFGKDKPAQKPSRPKRTRKLKAPAPRLRPKMYYGDPGI